MIQFKMQFIITEAYDSIQDAIYYYWVLLFNSRCNFIESGILEGWSRLTLIGFCCKFENLFFFGWFFFFWGGGGEKVVGILGLSLDP